MPGSPTRRVLLIAHELPPSAGGGVQRLTKFARLLVAEGWDVVAISAEPLPGRPRDGSLLTQIEGIPVHRLPARDVATGIARVLAPLKRIRSRRVPPARHMTFSNSGSDDGAAAPVSGRSPLSARLTRWVAMPDGAVVWAARVPAYAERLHRESPFDVILASGPPFSTLVAGIRTGGRLGVPVVVDMRDAWKNAYHAEWPTARRRRRFVEIEGEVMTAASAVVAVSEPIAAEVKEMGARRVTVLPNGFDPDEMPEWSPDPSSPLRLAFMGRLSPGSLDPTVLFSAIARARQLDPFAMEGFALDITGPDAPWAREMAVTLGVGDMVRFHPFKPYRDILEDVARADCGVITLADTPASAGVYSGKLFDYLGIGIPILVFGPHHSGAAALALETGCGRVVPGDDVELGARTLVELAAAKKRGERGGPCRETVRARFNRRDQVARLSALLHEVIGD